MLRLNEIFFFEFFLILLCDRVKKNVFLGISFCGVYNLYLVVVVNIGIC